MISKLIVQNDRIPLLLLLVTPSYIRFLNDDSRFIPNLLRQSFDSLKHRQNFDVVVAVVDQIPYPSIPKNSAEEVFGDWLCHGCEGISAMFMDSESAAPDLWSHKKNLRQKPMTATQLSVLSFQIEDISKNSPSSLHVFRTFQLPVANTLFHNERISTLFATRWILDFTSRTSSEFVCADKIELPYQNFKLNAHSHLLSVPLRPITPPRVVAAALGNIVRQMFVDQISKEKMAASRDLEEAIGQLFKSGDISAPQVVIWALVTPQEYRIDQPMTRNYQLQDKIGRGSRLHRVLSSGGGWGAKKDLLALDPVSQYLGHRDETQKITEDHGDINAGSAQALGEIVKPGDVITFYIQQHPKEHRTISTLNPQLHQDRSWIVDVTPSIHFGTLPSNVEASANTHQSFDFVLVKNHFGMLSESGMGLKIEKSSQIEPAEPFSEVVTTKVDPPFSYFSTADVGVIPKVSVTKTGTKA